MCKNTHGSEFKGSDHREEKDRGMNQQGILETEVIFRKVLEGWVG
jgi:hypothetical protein